MAPKPWAGRGTLQQQKLLSNVRSVRWRLYDSKNGWREHWPTRKDAATGGPKALELQLSVGRFEGIRRVLLLPEGE